MPYKTQLQQTFQEFPGILEKVNELNSILVQLDNKGLQRLVQNCLKNKSSYSSVPFLFEVFIARWIINNITIPDYEPEISTPRAKPDFTFSIKGKNFIVSLKSIIQVSNEETKKKIIKEIKKRFGNTTPNIQIWLSPQIEANDINAIVGWIVEKTKSLSIGDEEQYLEEEETLATIKKLGGHRGNVMVEIIGTEPLGGLLPPIDEQRIKSKLKKVVKKAYKCFVNDDEKTYNFLFLTVETSVFPWPSSLMRDLLNEVFSGSNFSKLDAIFFFHPKTDFLNNKFDPTVIVNPQKKGKIQKLPDPFKGLMTLSD